VRGEDEDEVGYNEWGMKSEMGWMGWMGCEKSM
jgi:hypothetical protein